MPEEIVPSCSSWKLVVHVIIMSESHWRNCYGILMNEINAWDCQLCLKNNYQGKINSGTQ